MTKRNITRCGILWRTHIVAIILCLLVSIPVLALIKNDLVLMIILLLVYISGIYFNGWNDGFKDSRKIGDFFPDFPGALRVAALAAALPFILLVVRIVAYHTSGGEQTLFLTLSDVVYRVYNFYFTSMMSNGNVFVYFVPVLIPSVVYLLGYTLGIRRFDFAEKYLPKIIYQQKKDKGKDKRFR